jgi:SOS-response transcriptional repressor LexA
MRREEAFKEFRELKERSGWSFPVLAEKLGISTLAIPAEVSHPLRLVSREEAEMPYIGRVSAGTPAYWSDPLDSHDFEPVDIRLAGANRFCAKVEGTSMIPLLVPDDLLVFEAPSVQRLGIVVLHRSTDNLLAVKELKLGSDYTFVLHSLNPSVPDEPATGVIVGHLVGIITRNGSRISTEFDATGIKI